MSKYWHLSAGKMKVFSLGLLIFSVLAVNAHAQGILGDAGDFAVLGGQSVTNTGATTLGGDLGVSPGSSLTGTGTITFSSGGIEPAFDGLSLSTAQSDALTAYDSMAALSGTNLTGTNLGGLILGAGVYNFSSSAQLTRSVILNFGGASNETIVIVIGSTLTTASGSSVSIENAGSNDSVYWVVGSSATLGSSTSFEGNIIALTSDSLVTGAKDGCGSIIALNGSVTLEGNTIDTGCSYYTPGTPGSPSPTPTPGPGTYTVPEGGSSLLYLCFSLLPIGTMWAFRFRRRSI